MRALPHANFLGGDMTTQTAIMLAAIIWLWFLGGMLFETSCILARHKGWMSLGRAGRIWCRLVWPLAMTVAIAFDKGGIADKVASKEK